MKTEIRISPLFFAVVAVLLISGAGNTVLIALFSGILHECGHLVSCLCFSSPIKEISLSYYGMKLIRKNELALSLSKEIAVSLSGVAVNFLICIVFFIINIFSPQTVFEKVTAVIFLLGSFNLLPVFSLDGGRALSYFLLLHFDSEKSDKILYTVSLSLLIPILVFGIYLAVFNRNYTLLICALYLIVSSI